MGKYIGNFYKAVLLLHHKSSLLQQKAVGNNPKDGFAT